ncbi:hypothetical protein A2U01_0063387, partial [Trifolium medium]|nr:hypothetical protein [Trifolium medium]
MSYGKKKENETVFPNECIDSLKIPCWRAAPSVLRDAQ